MTSLRERKMLREWRERIVVRLRKKMRQQRGLQRMMDATERLGLYDAELADLAYLFDRDKVKDEQSLVRNSPEPNA